MQTTMNEIRIYVGNYEGVPMYTDIPEEEYNELLEAGWTWPEINLFYMNEDWQTDC